MATTLEVLVTRLEAQTEQYEKALKSARKVTDKSTKGINKALRTMALRFVGFAAVVMAARKAYRAFTAGMRRIDALAKAADKLGMTTEALVGLQHAAKLTGIEQNTLNMALQRMTRRVAEAGIGMGEAQGALKELGLEAQEMVRLAPDEMFMKIAGAIKGVESPANRLRLAFKLFDSEGAELVRTLDLGEDGLRGMAAQAKRMGLAVTRDMARGVEKANDALTVFKGSIDGLTNSLVVKLSPAIEHWAIGATNAADRVREALSGVGAERRQLLATMAEVSKKTFEHWEQEGRSVMDVVSKYPILTAGYALYLKEKRDLQAAEIAAEAEKQAALNSWTNAGIKQREEWEKMSAGVRAQTVLGQFRGMVSAIGEESRTMFEISKGLAYAEAVVNTAAAITKNLATYAGPLGGIMAGIAGAAGAAQIAAIAATQYQKGGGGAGAAAGGAGAGAAAGAGGAAPAQTPLDVSITMQGSRFTDSEVRELIGAIDGQLADGVQMRSLRVS